MEVLSQQKMESSDDVVHVSKTSEITPQRVPANNCGHVLAIQTDQAPTSTKYTSLQSLEVSTGGILVSKTPEVPHHQRVPTNYCGHPSSSSASSSPKSIGRLPAHGEVVVSTDSAVPSFSSAVPDSGLCQPPLPPVDCCLASNPSITQPTWAGQQITEQLSRAVQQSNLSASQHMTVQQGRAGAGQHTVTQSLQQGAGRQIGEQIGDRLAADGDVIEATSSTVSSESISEPPQKGLIVSCHCVFNLLNDNPFTR